MLGLCCVGALEMSEGPRQRVRGKKEGRRWKNRATGRESGCEDLGAAEDGRGTGEGVEGKWQAEMGELEDESVPIRLGPAGPRRRMAAAATRWRPRLDAKEQRGSRRWSGQPPYRKVMGVWSAAAWAGGG